MPTVLRRNGFEFRIHTDDHEPSHVHVFKAEGEVIINLGDARITCWKSGERFMVKCGRWEYTREELDRMHREAVKRARHADRTEPRAASVRYDADANRLVIELKNGTTLLVPCDLVQGLRDATPAEIAAVELTPRGAALHWEALDTDISIPGLMAGVFGTKTWMAELERRHVRSTSKAKHGRPRQPATAKALPSTNRQRRTKVA